MEFKTRDEIFTAIREWEMEAGESFVDYFDGRLNEGSYLFWCLGKGYIIPEQFHAWEAESMAFNTDIVFGDEEYSVVREPKYDYKNPDEYEEAYKKAMLILAEFLSLTYTYQHRLKEFFEKTN